MKLPKDVARLRSEAYGHKTQAAYHRRRLRETMAKLARRCGQLGIPVPPLPNAQGSTEGERSDDGDRDRD